MNGEIYFPAYPLSMMHLSFGSTADGFCDLFRFIRSRDPWRPRSRVCVISRGMEWNDSSRKRTINWLQPDPRQAELCAHFIDLQGAKISLSPSARNRPAPLSIFRQTGFALPHRIVVHSSRERGDWSLISQRRRGAARRSICNAARAAATTKLKLATRIPTEKEKKLIRKHAHVIPSGFFDGENDPLCSGAENPARPRPRPGEATVEHLHMGKMLEVRNNRNDDIRLLEAKLKSLRNARSEKGCRYFR